MLTVHHLENSRSQRILWLLEELGVTYQVTEYARDPKTLAAPAALKAVHPLGKSPVITDTGETVAETGAIFEYVLGTFGTGGLMPDSAAARRRVRYWLHYAEGSAMPPLLVKLVLARLPLGGPGPMKPLVRAIARRAQTGFIDPQLQTHFNYWEDQLATSGWFAGGDFSAADIMMSYPVEAAADRAAALQGRPRLTAFLEKIHARPAYRRALQRGGPYAYAA